MGNLVSGQSVCVLHDKGLCQMAAEFVPSVAIWPFLPERNYIDNVPAMFDKHVDAVHCGPDSQGNKDMIYRWLGLLDALNECIGIYTLLVERLKLDIKADFCSRNCSESPCAVSSGARKRPYRR
jgi:hypothetical protein